MLTSNIGSLGWSNWRAAYFGGNLTAAVQNGTLADDRVDDMIRRIMTPYFFLHQDQGFPPIDGQSSHLNVLAYSPVYLFNIGPSDVDVRDNHAQHIRELGAAGTVLLKNVNNTLPLRAPKSLGVFGNDAGEVINGLYFSGTAFGPYGFGKYACYRIMDSYANDT
jgi:beta-glucosidase